MKTINIIKILGIIGLLFLLPSISNAQIQRVWSIAEYTSTMLPPPATGTKVAYRTLNNSLYYWNGSAWIRIAGPGIVDTSYSLSFSSPNLSLLGSGSSVSLTNLYTPGWGLLKTAEEFKVDSSKVASRYYTGTNPTTIANNYIATSNGTNLVARNLFDNNTYVGILNSKPFQLGQWTTAGRPSGVTGYEGYNTTGNGKEWYQGSRWAYALESTFARGTPTRVLFFDANGQVTENINFAFNASTTRATIWTTTSVNQGLDIGTNPTAITAPLVVTINSAGRAFILANSSTEYTDFVSGGVEKGMRGTGSVPFVLSNTGDVFFRTAGTERGRFTSGGLFGVGTGSPSYFFEMNSTGAMGLTRGTTAQRPSVVAAKTPFRYNTDSTDVEFGESSGVWRVLADREYVRSFVRTSANPTASIGLIAVNGSATTYMRSDASPALSQAIRPTWTDRHRFADTTWMDKNLEMDYASKIRLGGTSGDYSYGVRGDNISGNLTTIMHSFSQVAIGFTPDNAVTFNYPFFFDGNGRAKFNADSTNDQSRTLMNSGSVLVGYDTTEAPEMKSLLVAGKIGQGTLHPDEGLHITDYIKFSSYGTSATTASALSKTQSNYVAGFATDGTVTSREIKRDTTIYVDDADYDFSAAITTAQIASRFNRVIFWMTTTAAAGSDSELTLHTPDANLMQVEYLIHSVDEPAGFDNKIVFGTNNAVDSTNGLVTNYYPAAGDGIHIRAGLRSGVYKYRYSN